MSANENTTPEEKLLNLIRRSDKKHTQQKQSAKVEPSRARKFSGPQLSAAGDRQLSWKQERALFSGIKSINFIFLNRLILFVSFIAFLCLLFDLFYHSPKFNNTKTVPAQAQKAPDLKTEERRPFSYYEQEIAQRQLFAPGPAESNVKRVIPAGPTFKELIKGLRLLGIVSGDKTQVIIEDEKLRQTYFLYAGDYLGEIKVEEVYADRVTLEFNGERISLFL